MRKPSLKTLSNRLTAVHAVYCKLTYGRCVTCGSTANLQCSHLFSRISRSTRWDDPMIAGSNCAAQCAGCNLKHEHNSYPYNRWFIDQYGEKAWDDLQKRWHQVFQPHRQFFEDRIAHFEAGIAVYLLAHKWSEVPRWAGVLPAPSKRAVCQRMSAASLSQSSTNSPSTPPTPSTSTSAPSVESGSKT